jgi:hypothetical protein
MKRIRNGLLTAATLGLFLLLPAGTTSVQAQDGYWDRQGDQRERRRERRERRRERREERRERRDERRDRNDVYSDNGYYNDGYSNNGYYGASSQLRQTAINAGYNEGLEEGRKDRERRDRYDYSDEGDYRSATKNYNSRFGDRETYRQYFRQGFQAGYRDGYNGNHSGYNGYYNY